MACLLITWLKSFMFQGRTVLPTVLYLHYVLSTHFPPPPALSWTLRFHYLLHLFIHFLFLAQYNQFSPLLESKINFW
jgi:hypothetical protein